MRYFTPFILCIFLTACASRMVKQQVSVDSSVDFTTIEGLSDYIFKKTFPAIISDTSLLRLYNIKQVPMEGDDGATWDAYECYHHSELLFTIENNWESKNRIDRITFIRPEIKTKQQIFAGAPFRNIRQLVDTLKLNHGPDGYLFFFDVKYPCMTYYFELPEGSKLVYGVRSLRDVPDSLKIDAIIMQDCHKN